jgi:hypothetical protein
VTTLLADLSNSNVQWDGNRFGLMPTLSGAAANQLLDMGPAALPALLEALSDPDKFVSAHVVLTKLSGVEYQSFPAWNGLEVILSADGTVSIDPAQQPVLIERWRRWYQTEPHPAVLPSPG